MRPKWFWCRAAVLVLLSALLAGAQPPAKPAAPAPEARAARYLDAVRGNPLLLNAFLRALPKGGDLHSHLSGAVYAESYIGYAAHDGLCIDRRTMAIVPPPCDAIAPPEKTCGNAARPPATCAQSDAALYRDLIDAFSMRHFTGQEAGLYHFFDAFGKFGAVSRTHVGEMLAEVVGRAAAQNLSYVELILNLDRGRATGLGQRLGWDDDFDRFRKKVDEGGAAEIVAAARQILDAAEADMRGRFGCVPPGAQSIAAASPGCAVTVRYVYEVYRGLPREQVFAQMQLGFEIAAADPRVVSVNPVMPEDGATSMSDFDLHMRMFQYFHRLYPQVRLSMHAGELAPGLVPPQLLGTHVRAAVAAGAERIGHGDDVMYDAHPLALLRELRARNVMVEICLSSNDYILGVTGARHPLPLYLKYGVPVALATDDEGVSRSDITREFQRAVETYHLGYADLKKFARTSLEHAFVDAKMHTELLHDLERRFAAFEQTCCGE